MLRLPLRMLALAGLLACAIAAQAADPAPASAVDKALDKPADKAAATAPLKVLRYAFPAAESGFDPAQVTDLYSNTVIANILEAPLEYEYLAQPVRLRPATALAMPEVSDNFRRFVFTLRPGILFADDPAFNGQPRELTAADYVYSLKRHYDPRWKSGKLYRLEGAKILGLSEIRAQALAQKTPFDYDREAEGLRALDRYRFEIRLAEPAPRFLYTLADQGVAGAVAREVVERYGDKINEHPVGTGPYRLTAWTRSSRMVLTRNPRFRERLYDEHPPADDPRRQAIARSMAGKRLAQVDRIEISIIEESQPRWLSFLNREFDFIERVPDEFSSLAMPNNQLAPNLARQGVQMQRYRRADAAFSYFAMEHPLVGGYTPDKVALRRAIALAVDVDREIRLVRRNQAIPGQALLAPETWGYDPSYKTEMGEFSRAKAMALLDLYGYVDRDGDGWRDQPDGQPLVLEYATSPDSLFRALYEQWQINMDAIRVRMVPKIAQWPEHLKASRAGKLMMWGVSWGADEPDAQSHLGLGYGPNKGQANHARFDLPAFNALYRQQAVLPDGPERLALIRQAQRLLVAYMPYKVHVHRIWTDMNHPWVVGYHRNIYVRDFFKYVDVDLARAPAGGRP